VRKPQLLQGLSIGLLVLSMPPASSAGVFINITVAPPPLPVYVQPPCPTDGYLWNPGYWAYGDAGYYWVPGVWVAPPSVGLLWTPPYWGFAGGIYGFHAGYWGPHVGFYGGVNYGFGYGGVGFAGGAWQGGHFAYNTAVTRVNTTVIHNTYNRTVVVNNNHTSFNGPGGITARPTPAEMAASHEQHVAPTPMQASHERGAARQVAANHPPAAARQAENRPQPQAHEARPQPQAHEAKPQQAPRPAPHEAHEREK